MQKLNPSLAKEMFIMFARGDSCDRVAETTQLSHRRVKKRYRQYLALPLGKKLRATLLPESVANRMHRLIDDIIDIERIDALLPSADEKALVSLLDIKRKIKERMMKDVPTPETLSGEGDPEINDEIAQYYNHIFGDTDSG